jgi:predicted ABC-type ATPase
MPQVYVIAGPNGVGKTTLVRNYLPTRMKKAAFLNADMIAHGLSPFDPAKSAVQAGRLLLARLRELAASRADFALETTLTGRSYFLRELKASGYDISLDLLWVPSLEITRERVRRRVAQGGHDIPEYVQERRFGRSLRLLIELYRPLLRDWRLMENSGLSPHIVTQEYHGEFRVFDYPLLNEIEQSAGLSIADQAEGGRVDEPSMTDEGTTSAVLRAAWLAYADAILDGQRYQTAIVKWQRDRGVVLIPPELLVPLARRIIEVNGHPLPDDELHRLNAAAQQHMKGWRAIKAPVAQM